MIEIELGYVSEIKEVTTFLHCIRSLIIVKFKLDLKMILDVNNVG